MDSVGGTQSNEERGAERLMDSYLKSIGLHRKKIAKDGSCLFRAVAEQVLHCQSLHTEVRAKCVEFLRKNRESYEAFIEGDFEDYLFKLQDPQWVGEVEINALAVMYKRDFLIYQEPDKPPVNITDNNFKDKVQLCFLNGNHYDSVYPVSHIKDAALCQSILYELLYDGVFKVDRGSLGPCQRTSRPSDLLIDDNMNACASSDESDLDAGDALWVENGTSSTTARTQSHRGRGRGRHLPERVRRSLNPTLFRNVEYDVWQKTKRAQQKMDYCIAAGMQFTVGDRCQVRLEGRSYNAIVKEVPPNNGPMTVYIEELGSRKQVPLWSLRPPSDENSWSTVVHRDKRLSNGHGDWEERGRGRGRGKHVPASPSSVAQATAPGSSGRVQKQHSWPPQATVEEQAKATRKSVSLVESAFGLTEEERLAKEEEERNVALVEIQLRDEQSFPALGTDGGKKKGGEKKRSQRNKTKSPVEDVGAPSPSVGERPKSPTPPLTSTAAATNTTSPTTLTPPPATPPAATPPAAKPPAAPSVNSNNPAWLSSVKASTPKINMAAAPPASSLTCAQTPKTNSYAVAAAPSSPPPPAAPPAAAAPSSKPPVMGGAVPLLSLQTPPLPAASSPLSSSSPPPSSSSSTPPSSVQPPTFIAPIAPSPTAAQGFLPPASLPRSSPPVSSVPQSPSPPSSSSSSSSSSSLIPQAAQVHEAPPVSAQNSFPNIGGTQTASQSPSSLPQNLSQISVSKSQTQASLTPSETQTRSPLHQNTQILMPQTQTEVQSALPQIQQQPQSHTEVTSLPQSSVPQMSLPQSSVPQTSLPQSPVLQTSLSQSPVLQTSLPQSSVLQTSVPQSSVPQTSLPQTSLPQSPVPQTSLPQSPVPQTSLPQSPVLQTSLPKSSISHLQSQSEVAQLQSSSLPSTPQASVPPSVPPPITQPHPDIQTTQPPHPSQVPLPSVSLSSSHPSLQPQTPNNPSETPLPPPQHPQPPPESPSQSPSQPSHPPHPQLQSAPPHLQSIPGAVPLQQLSQLYQDPLYPGFPQGEKGEVAPTPSFSSSKSGDDLPQDINILKFFFNLGVKAYSMPMFPPYIYLLPLQQAHTLNPKLPSRSPSPHHVPSNPPSRQGEAHPHPHYPPTSASISPQYDHQAPPPEPPHPGDPSFTQARYPVTQPPPHRMPCSSLPWQPPPRNPSYQIVYPASNPPYRAPAPLSHGFPSAQGPRHPVYPPYPPSSLGYQPSSSPEELQVSQGPMEQHQPANVDPMPCRVPGPLESPAAANMANANGNRTVVVPGLTLKKEQGDSLTRAVLLVDPPLNNTPIITLVSNPDVKDVSMATMKPNSSPGSPLPYDMISKTTVSVDNSLTRGYRGHQKPLNPPNTYVPLRQPEPSQASYLTTVGLTESLSVGCSTEAEWEGIKPATLNHRGSRRSYRGGGGGRGRGGHDPWRGGHRRRGGDTAVGINYVQFSSSHRGRGRERGY